MLRRSKWGRRPHGIVRSRGYLKSRLAVAKPPSKGVRSTSLRAIRFITSPSRCQRPYTASSRDCNSAARCVSRTAFQQITCTTPVSSSRVMKVVPLAVGGCCRSVTMPQWRTMRPSGTARRSCDDISLRWTSWGRSSARGWLRRVKPRDA